MSIFFEKFFAVLNERYDYVVLRNHDGLPYYCESRDIDVLVSKRQFGNFMDEFHKLLNVFGLKIIFIKKQQDIVGVCFLDGSSVYQIDVFKNVDILGVKFIDENEFLSRRIFNGLVYHLNFVDILLIKSIYCSALCVDLSARYVKMYSELTVAEREELSYRLRRIGFSSRTIRTRLPLVRQFFKNLFHSPLKTLSGYLLSSCLRIKNWISPIGFIISFTGPDGCGKTTVINLLMKRLDVNPPLLFHFRPSILPNLGEVGVKTGIKKDVDRNYSVPHRGKKHGKLNSLVRLCYYSLDYILGYLIKILPLRQHKHIVFFDRYYSDIIVDHERSGIFLSHKFLAWWRHLIPSCQYNFFFKVNPDIILSRKQELSRDAIERIYSRMEYLATVEKKCFWIDNNGTPEDAVRQILTIIADRQHKKYAKKL